jgi:hypothetical protein
MKIPASHAALFSKLLIGRQLSPDVDDVGDRLAVGEALQPARHGLTGTTPS